MIASTYNNEQLKIIIDFSDVNLPNYVAGSMYADDKFITEAEFNWQSRNNKLGSFSFTGSSASLDIYDENDTLNVNNNKGLYFGVQLLNRKVLIYKSGFNGDTPVWKPYGEWYIRSSGNNYASGWHDVTSLSLEDGLSELGNNIMPNIEYSGSTGEDAVVAIFNALGIGAEKYDLSEVNLSTLTYTALPDGKVRDALIDICNLSFTYITVDVNGVYVFKNLFSSNTSTPDFDLDYTVVGEIAASTEEAENYNNVSVKYAGAKALAYKQINSLNSIAVHGPTAKIKLSTGDEKVMSIEQMSVLAHNTGSLINYTYKLLTDSIDIDLLLSNDEEHIISVTAYGLAQSYDKQTSITVAVPGSSESASSDVYEYTSKLPITETEAYTIAHKFVNMIKTLRHKITISHTMLSPDLTVGLVVRLTNTGTAYDGLYTVDSIKNSFGSEYSCVLTLIKTVGEE